MALVVAPVDQAYADPLLAVRVTVCPCVKLVDPLAAIVTTGAGFTVTEVADEVREQIPLLTVTVYEPAAFAVIDDVVAPLDQV